MSNMQKKRFSKSLFLVGLFVFGGSFLLSGCANAPKTLNSAISGPQVIVNPESISLGVAALTGAKIVFEGSGFKPEDSVFITLFGPNKTEAVVADGKVGSDGKFTAAVGTLAKVTGILKGNVSGKYAADGSYDQFIVITQPPIPAGIYTAKATSMLSDLTAETKLTITEPSVGDSLKDWLGEMTGKIVDKQTK
ncbi:MAG: hypothetical protein A2031_05995 [Deltaproteobacteria bacterium RBG_19FT_COMBO_43_11]|nr:MAG: hypothetical protein A2W27_03280 [Deltaproteobacteria bacterium RBG_16_44_11]OGP89781.1 MAG: hypothetical protein A2031_05995 [Deltaproteobacteria bacterium RBG_19FT_COMBO_43_11]